VRQRNEIKLRSGPFGAKLAADDLIQFPDWNELRDRQFSDRNHEPRLQDFELAIQPRWAVGDLLRVGNPVAPAGGLAWETTTDRSEINSCPNGVFLQAGRFLKTAEERLSRRPGKRSRGDWLADTGRLADQKHFAHHRATRDRRRMHQSASPAITQPRDMPLESRLSINRARHFA
jgi:hypothetical protein